MYIGVSAGCGMLRVLQVEDAHVLGGRIQGIAPVITVMTA